MSFVIGLLLRLLVSIGVIAALDAFLPQYVLVDGGWQAYAIIGAILAVLNLVVRPILNILTLPLRLLASVLALILVNGVFVWILVKVMEYVDPSLARFEILGEWQGWVVIAVVLGLAHWVMKMFLR